MSRRRTHSPDFKARVAMWAISDRKTIQEIAADHAVQSADEAAQLQSLAGSRTLPHSIVQRAQIVLASLRLR